MGTANQFNGSKCENQNKAIIKIKVKLKVTLVINIFLVELFFYYEAFKFSVIYLEVVLCFSKNYMAKFQNKISGLELIELNRTIETFRGFLPFFKFEICRALVTKNKG